MLQTDAESFAFTITGEPDTTVEAALNGTATTITLGLTGTWTGQTSSTPGSNTLTLRDLSADGTQTGPTSRTRYTTA